MSTSIATLNIASIELVSTQRVAPLNGSPSSEDYNDSAREVLTDLASLSEFVNGTVIPLLNCLPATSPLLLDGSAIYASTAATSDPLFFDTTAHQPLTIAAVITRLNQIVSSIQTQMTNLSAQVLALQTRLATTNQNDVAKAIQGLASTIAAVAARVTALGG
jgi:hypothetical protein